MPSLSVGFAGIAWSNSVKKRQAVAGSGWEAAAVVGGLAGVRGRGGAGSDKFQQSLVWRCPRSSSSTVVGHSCYAAVTCSHSANCADDRRDFPGAALGPVIDMPVAVQRHMHSPRVSRSSTSLSWRRGFLLGPECSGNHVIHQLQSIEKVVDVTVGQVQQIPRVLSVRRQPRSHSCTRRLRSWTKSLTCPLCATTNARG